MGLLSQNAQSASSAHVFGGRLGMGVGMGGTRTGGYGKVDQIGHGRSGEPLPFREDPFSNSRPIGLASPGAEAVYQNPLDSDGDSSEGPVSPLRSRGRQDQLHSSLLAPPLTQKVTSIRTPRRVIHEAAERRQKKEEMKAMMDAESNPFLSRPGELVHPGRAGPIVDETRSTVTYVFRGTKKIFANPFLRPDQPFPPAECDPGDEEFEPHPCPPPRLLWTSGPRRDTGGPLSPSATSRFRRRGLGDADLDMDLNVSGSKHAFTDDEASINGSEEEEEALPVRRGLLFAPDGPMKRALIGGEETLGKKTKSRKG